MTLRMLAATAALGVALVVTGCVPSEPVVTPAETGATAPIFATDEEALAAAVAAYEDYQRAVYELGSKVTHDFEPLRPLLTDEWFAKEVEGLEELFSQGRVFSGFTTVKEALLQQRWEESPGSAHVVLYICVDISATRIITTEGRDVTPSNRIELVPLEVSFLSSDGATAQLLTAKVAPWDDLGLC